MAITFSPEKEAMYAKLKAEAEASQSKKIQEAAKKAGLTADSNGYYSLKNDATGESATVSGSVLQDYLSKGYDSASNPIDYSKLGANSVYRTENRSAVGNAYVPPATIVNAPADYVPLSGTKVSNTSNSTTSNNNSSLINSSYDSLISALKNQIQQSINNKNTQISGLTQKYQPQKNTSEVQRYSNLRSILEQNANVGDRGGVGRQAALQTQTAADNRLNDINLQQSSEEASLRNDIANLLLEGDIQTAQYQAQKLQSLLSQNNTDRSYDYQAGRDAVSDQRYNQEYADTQLAQQKQEYANNINRFYNDFTAEINKVKNDGNTSNDWQIAQLEAARTQKVAEQKAAQQAAEQKAAAANTEAQQNAIKTALDIWKTQGYANEYVSSVLGVPTNSKTADYNIDSIKTSISAAKASNSSSSSSSSKTMNNTYQDAITQYNNMDPGAAIRNLTEYSNEIISQIGSANYNKLVASTQGRLYQTMVSTYNDFTPSAAYSSVLNNRDHITGQIGAENYNKLLASQKKRYDAMNK